MSLIIVGSVAFDQIETPFGKTDKIVGGAGTYISYSASYFAPKAHLVSVVGDDFPGSVLQDLNKRGVSTNGVELKKGEKSFFWAGKYHNDMNSRDTLATELNVLAEFKPLVPEEAQHADFLMLGNLSPDVQLKVIEQLPKKPKMVVLDTMNFWMDIALDDLKKVLTKIDVLTINDEEARQLTGEYSLVKAAKRIFEMGPKYLIIKKGEHGALLFNQQKEVFFAPALPLEEVFDPTGAGDSFAGGFIGYLSQQKEVTFDTMKRAVIYGSAMASFCVEKFGTEKLEKLSAIDVKNRVEEFINLTQLEIELTD